MTYLHREEVPTPEEVEALLAAAPSDAYYMFLALTCALGTWRCETLGLRWSCWDPEDQSVLVDAMIDRGRHLHALPAWATRRVAIGPLTNDLLYGWRASWQYKLSLHGLLLNPNSFVFNRDLRGERPLHHQWASNQFPPLRQAAGVRPAVTLRSLGRFHP